MARPSRTGGKTSAAKARKASSVKGRNRGKTKRSIAQTAIRPKRSPPSDLGKELKEAREQQAATAEILKAIAASPGDVQPVLDAVAVQTNRLVGGFTTVVWRILEDVAHLAAYTQADPAADEALKAAAFRRPLSSWQIGETIRKGQVFSVADTERDVRSLRDLARVRGFRSILYVPMMHNHEPIGVIGVTRSRAGKFADHHVKLLKTFADQAVIAIENSRLFYETREALERQTATADILKVIASSPSDTTPVFDAIASSANRLLGGFSTAVFRFADETVRLSAFTPVNPDADAILQSHFPRPVAGFEAARLAQQGKPVQISETENAEDARIREAARSRGFRSMLFAPLMNKSVPIGVISVTRAMPGSFATHHVQLLQTFADQAVIAIENTRLFNEVRTKSRDLEESLQQQTATSEVLEIISSSPSDLAPVFDAMLANATRVCGAEFGSMNLLEGDMLRQVALYNAPTAFAAKRMNNAFRIHPRTSLADAVRDKQVVQVDDMRKHPAYLERNPSSVELTELAGARTIVVVPMLRKDAVVGVITVYRQEVRPFNSKQIELLTNFSRQAVIAIENAGLLKELRQRTDDLSEALTYQTGTSNILRVIASSPTNVEPVLEAIVASACQLCEANDAQVLLKEGGDLRFSAHHGPISIDVEKWPINRGWVAGRAFLDQSPVHVRDLLSDEGAEFPDGRQLTQHTSRRIIHTVLAVPLLLEKESIGAILLRRTEVQPFNEKQVSLLQSFADQAVIAIENTRLFNETKEALERQTATAEILKVIASSHDDVQPVFEAIAERSNRLIGGHATAVYRVIDQTVVLTAFTRVNPEADAALQASFPRPMANLRHFEEVFSRGEIVQIADTETAEIPDYVKQLGRVRGFRSYLFVPLAAETGPIGLISVTRAEPGLFSEHDISLLKTFADQAVIAIQNVRLFNETKEALERQTATADILKVIASSPSSLQPVFDAIAERSNELMRGHSTTVFRLIGSMIELAAFTPVSEAADAVLRAAFPRPRSTMSGLDLAFRGEEQETIDAELDTSETSRDIARARGFRGRLVVPLKGDGGVIGAISITRKEPGAFAEKDKELLRTFADQAVIAIQNVALFEEVQARTEDLRESLQQQTATADVLKVISRSAFDLKAVMDTLTRSASELCSADLSGLFLRENDVLVMKGHSEIDDALVEFLRQASIPVDETSYMGRSVLRGTIANIADFENDPHKATNVFQKKLGFKALLVIPLMREARCIGVFALTRKHVGAFSPKQVELVQTFADQAVIAIENVRLFDEVQARTRELSEALTHQTGSANILRVIASSPTDVKPVLQAIVESACELCEAYDAVVLLKDGEDLRFSAHHGRIPLGIEKWPINRRWVTGRAFVDRAAVHIHDLSDEAHADLSDGREMALQMGHRTILSAPLLREGEPIGAITLRRAEVHPFTDKQIALLQTFADQAVIAIGNVRLFEEVQARTRDLAESLQQQTATADVLKVISRSTFDLQAVLQALVESAARLSDSDKATITRQRDGVFYRAETYGFSDEFMEYARSVPIVPDRSSATGRALLEGTVVQIPDVKADADYTFHEGQRLGDFRAVLAVPMLRERVPIGVIVLTRTEARAFTKKQIEVVTTFADQAAIAIENVRLFESVQTRTRELGKSLEDLRAAQDRLIQTEKLASLGQLTAGIAHEIKNPLNFVNNFSALSAELTGELNDLLKEAALTEKMREEVSELTRLLQDNLEKVVQHGKRADSIVKNMLLHSREGTSERRSADVNLLVGESLNLAYHGARAEKADFNITLKRDLDPSVGAIELYPQELTRALLNLISNGFYAANRRKRESGDRLFEPVLSAATRNGGETVEIRIRDNGVGIPPDVREKMFNPFFTTKPTGEGTGLGLSMTHDIVVKQHGGRIDVLTEPGEFTEFVITLPRDGRTSRNK